MNIPFKMDIMNRLLDGNENDNRWKSLFLIVNGNEYQMTFDYSDLLVCNKDGILTCFIANNGTNGYECHLQYKVALYASNSHYSEEPDLYIPVLDYEVYHCY